MRLNKRSQSQNGPNASRRPEISKPTQSWPERTHGLQNSRIIITRYNKCAMIQLLMRILPKLLAAACFIEAMEPRVLFALPTLWTTQGPGGGGSYFSANVNG